MLMLLPQGKPGHWLGSILPCPSFFVPIFLTNLLFFLVDFAFFIVGEKCTYDEQVVTLAGPGVAIATIITASIVKYVFPYGWDWNLSLMLGGILSATDPVAVVALLKDLGQAGFGVLRVGGGGDGVELFVVPTTWFVCVNEPFCGFAVVVLAPWSKYLFVGVDSLDGVGDVFGCWC